MNKEFQDLFIGQVFDYEFMFDDVFIRGIKKSSRTALMFLDKREIFLAAVFLTNTPFDTPLCNSG